MQYFGLIFGTILLMATFSLNMERPQSNASGFIMFASSRTSKSQMHIMGADGSIIKPIKLPMYGISNPHWSPDSKWIYFSWSDPLYRVSIFDNTISQFQGDYPTLFSSALSPNETWSLVRGIDNQQGYIESTLYLIRPDSTYLEEIHKSINEFSWLDNHYFYFVSDGDTYIMSVDKEILSQVDEFWGFVAYYDATDKLLFISHLEQEWFGQRFYALYQLAVGSSKPELVVHQDLLKDYWVYWIIDTQTILAERYDKTTNYSYLETLDISTGTTANILSYEGHLRFSTFSPDRHWFLFEISSPEELYILDLDSYVSKPLSQDISCRSNSSWSPDSKWIAFQAEVDGNIEIFRIRPDGTDLTNLTQHPANDANPSWSPFVDKTWHSHHFSNGSLAILGLVVASQILLFLHSQMISLIRRDKYGGIGVARHHHHELSQADCIARYLKWVNHNQHGGE